MRIYYDPEEDVAHPWVLELGPEAEQRVRVQVLRPLEQYGYEIYADGYGTEIVEDYAHTGELERPEELVDAGIL
ncbi:unnamed protein product [Amoebophrya sp. A120]|nr:unnamed protein product [Amoebophrya sp. A120]|eukprot:GSA120T00015814001.1